MTTLETVIFKDLSHDISSTSRSVAIAIRCFSKWWGRALRELESEMSADFFAKALCLLCLSVLATNQNGCQRGSGQVRRLAICL